MSNKPRQTKGKYTTRSKRKKGVSPSLAITAEKPSVAEASEPVMPPKLPKAKAEAAPVAVATAQYTNVVTELKRIGVLAGILVVILIILAFVIP